MATHEHYRAVLVRVSSDVFNGDEFGWQLPSGRVGRTLSRKAALAAYPEAALIADEEAAHPSGDCVFCAHLSE